MPQTEGAAAWWRTCWRALASEVFGTALLVALGCASVVPTSGETGVALVRPAIGFGGTVAALVSALGSISGAHFNPAVTIANALSPGGIAPVLGLAYIVAQVLGAVIGMGALMFAEGSAMSIHAVTAPAPGIGAPAAVAVEAFLTGLLVLACCGIWTDHRLRGPQPTAPILLSLVIAGLVFSGGPLTGASLNPARSFGPALLMNSWNSHWVYWLGPISGGVLAALIHRALSTSPVKTSTDSASVGPDAVPLQDKPFPADV